jgi:WD40 repeat protein
LVSALVGDVAGEPGGLPLLSAALVELWQRRDGRTLRYEDYERSGGVEGAVARLAEDAYGRLSAAERGRARPMLLRLAGADPQAEALVRRRVSLSELEVDRDPDAARALAVLTEARLLTVDEDTVEVAHEALLREWPRLRGWLEADAEGRRLHHHLIGAAQEWRGSERDPAELYRGARLAAALDWASEHDPELNELERAFLDASKEASEREAERQRRANRRLRTLLAGVGVLLAAAVIAGVIALSERQGARDAATAETAQRLGAQAITEDRLDRALMLANTGVALDDSLATRSSLLSTLLRSPAAVGVLDGDMGIPQALALSPNGSTLAVGDMQGQVILLDTETRQQIGDHQLPGEPWSLAFDPRGNSLAIPASPTPGHPNASLQIVDPSTLRVQSSSLGPHPAAPGSYYYPTAVYAPDGRSVVVSYSTGDVNYSVPVFLRHFDARTGSPLGPAVRVAPKSAKIPLLSTADGRLFVSTATGGPGEGRTYAIDAETLRVLDRYPVRASSTAISPDGRTLAFETPDEGVRLLDLASGRVWTLANPRVDLGVGAFSPDGRTLSTWDDDGNVSLWNLDTGALTETFELPAATGDQEFSPDGRTLYTAAADPTAMIWDVAGDRRLLQPFRTHTDTYPSQYWPPSSATSPDGRTLAVGTHAGRVDLIDAETLRRTGGFQAFPGRPLPAIEYSPDGRRLAVAGGHGGLGLWDAGSGKRVGPLLSTPGGAGPRSEQLAFGPGGMLAAASTGGQNSAFPGAVRIWDLDGQKMIQPLLRLGHRVLGLAFGPDGSQLAIATPSGVEVRGLPGGGRLASLPTPEAALARDEVSLAFSPDGRMLAGGQQDGDVLVWATDGWRQVGQLPGAGALGVAFSPDGSTLATSREGAVRLWDVGAQQPIGSPLPLLAPGDSLVTTRFTPDGDRLFAVSDVGNAIRFEVDLEAWVQHACDVAGGDLTPEQWEEVVPEQEYRQVCPSG